MVGDRYRLDALLATGAWGQVWRARDAVLGRLVAVKVLRHEHTGDSAALTRFRTEARLSAALAHPNIAVLHDYGEVVPDPGQAGERLAYLVMDLVDGEALSEVLRRERRLSAERTLEIVRQTAAGLAAAHAAGVVHRDVKPGNLLIGPRGTVTLTDFGIAWTDSSDPLTGAGQVMGTAQYLSPEQARGAKAGPASDVYALGMVAYECLTGRRAFEGESSVQIALKHINETPQPLPADVPDMVRELVERAMLKDPEERFPDGAALLSAVEDVLGRQTPSHGRHVTTVMSTAVPEVAFIHARQAVSGPSLGPKHAASRPRPSRSTLVRLIALLVLAAVAVGGLFAGSVDGLSAPTLGRMTPTPTLTPAPTATGLLAVEAYVGRPVAEVEAELTERGLRVQLRPIQTADAPDGEVLAVDPMGQWEPLQSVTVTYAVAPAPGPPAPTPGSDAADAGIEAPAVDPLPTAPESSPTVETSAVPGKARNDRGNDRGNGRAND